MEMIDVLKSILLGLGEQTKMGVVNWMDESSFGHVSEKYYFLKDKEFSLRPTLYYQFNRRMILQVHFDLLRDGSLNYSWITFESDDLQESRLTIGVKQVPEYIDFEKIMFDKYIAPKIAMQSKNYETDMRVLINMTTQCGPDVVRDMKLNSILNEGSDKKGWFSKLF